MPVQKRILESLFDRRITAATAYHVHAHLGTLADENGIIHPDADGKYPSNPITIAHALGASKDAVWKAFTRLESLGYIEWDRATGADARAGVGGRVRIILSDSDHATAA